MALVVVGVLYVTYDRMRYVVIDDFAPGFWWAWANFAARTLALLSACGSMIVGMQLRLGWARVGTGVVLAAMVALQIVTALSSGPVGTVVVTASLQLLLAWRVVFGEPSRAYFAGKPVAPARSFEES